MPRPHRFLLAVGLGLVTLGLACGTASSPASTGGADGGEAGPGADAAAASEAGEANASDAGEGGAGCTLTANTTPSSTVTGGCALETRDTSGCQAARTAAGLSGFWLRFSCRVSLTSAAGSGSVVLASDGQPDHESNYFPTTDPCYTPYNPAYPDPNHIATHSTTMTVPLAPATAAGQTMGLGAVGMAIDGAAIFDNQAAPGDDIYQEAFSFDRCQGHPSPAEQYHYHSEPYAISSDDDAFIGVMRDGFPVYGRHDADGSAPTLDASGGHTGTTPDSPSTAVYHYHLNLQTSTSGQTAGQQVWFLTTGKYAGTAGSCTGC